MDNHGQMESGLSLTRSRALFEEAQELMPGGVNSPVRAFRAVGGDPVFIDHASGPYLYDVDGNRYLDYVQSWGPMILGHTHPAVLEAVTQASMRGFSFGAPTQAESILARLVIESVPSIEMVRFVNSGTEATMSALRLARAYTGRNRLSSLVVAIMVMPICCLYRQVQAWRRWDCRTAQACHGRRRVTRSSPLITIALP